MNTIIEKIRAEVERLKQEGDIALQDAEAWLKTVLDNEEFASREEALAWVEKMREKWGAEHRGSSEIPNDLEEAARKHSCYDEDCKGAWYEPIVRNAYIAGAKWQKEQEEKELSEKIASAYQLGLADKEKMMMKEAVEGRVVDAGIFATYNTPVEYTHSGDKVKIIIVKED